MTLRCNCLSDLHITAGLQDRTALRYLRRLIVAGCLHEDHASNRLLDFGIRSVDHMLVRSYDFSITIPSLQWPRQLVLSRQLCEPVLPLFQLILKLLGGGLTLPGGGVPPE